MTITNGNTTKPDGIIINGGKIYIAQNLAPLSSVVELESSDDWVSATIAAVGYSQYPGGSGVVFRDNVLYLTHSLFPPTSSSVIDVITFPPANATSTSPASNVAVSFLFVVLAISTSF